MKFGRSASEWLDPRLSQMRFREVSRALANPTSNVHRHHFDFDRLQSQLTNPLREP